MSNKTIKIEGQLPLDDWLKTPIKIGSTLAEIDKKIITEIYTAFHFHGGKNLSYRKQIDIETFFESSNNEDKFIIHCEVSETKLILELIDGYVTSITLLNLLQKIGIDPITQIEDIFGESDEITNKTYYYFDRDSEVSTYGYAKRFNACRS